MEDKKAQSTLLRSMSCLCTEEAFQIHHHLMTSLLEAAREVVSLLAEEAVLKEISARRHPEN